PVAQSPSVLSTSIFHVPFPADVTSVSVVIWTTTPWTLPANQAVCLHPDIDYAFVKVGPEVFIIAKPLVESVAKACSFSAHTILGAKKGSEGFEQLETQRPLTTGLS